MEQYKKYAIITLVSVLAYALLSVLLGIFVSWVVGGIMLGVLAVLGIAFWLSVQIMKGKQSHGVFGFLCVKPVVKKYPYDRKGEVVFYGASNFRLWEAMEEDLAPYKVQNHGIGGATDVTLMKFADKLLFPYEPYAVFLQTGSNGYAMGMTIEQVKQNKDKWYSMIRARLPHTPIVVMAGLPLPGRKEYWAPTQEVNVFIKEYCQTHDNMYFADATAQLTTETGDFRPELFRRDFIHFKREGQKIWSKPILEVLLKINAPKHDEKAAINPQQK